MTTSGPPSSISTSPLWPTGRSLTERLMLREPEARYRAAFIELLASPEVNTYLGGPRPRDELEREMPGAPERHPGLFVVDLGGARVGQVILRRATRHGPRAAAGKAELGYRFLPQACARVAELGSVAWPPEPIRTAPVRPLLAAQAQQRRRGWPDGRRRGRGANGTHSPTAPPLVKGCNHHAPARCEHTA